MYINTTGLVLRETAYMDSSKILTVLTEGEGKLTVSARGALRKNSKLAAVTQLLAFSEMTLYKNRDRWTMTEARSIEQFIGLRDDIKLLSLGAYFAELTEAAADEDSPNPELLSLCLNSLYALSRRIKTPEYIKPSFEFRLMALSGLAPLVTHCAICGAAEPERSFIDLLEGNLKCRECQSSLSEVSNIDQTAFSEKARSGRASLSTGALFAIRYILGCEIKKLFQFSVSDETLSELIYAAESYLLAQLDRNFRTLDYYKKIK